MRMLPKSRKNFHLFKSQKILPIASGQQLGFSILKYKVQSWCKKKIKINSPWLYSWFLIGTNTIHCSAKGICPDFHWQMVLVSTISQYLPLT